MKIKRYSFPLFALVFLLSSSFSEQRNLSTPLSRLVGHWKIEKPVEGGEYYFGPINPSTNTGQVTVVNPNADALMEFILSQYRYPQMTEQERGELKKMVEKEAGKAYTTNYRLVTYESDGTSITIEMWAMVDSSIYVPPDERWTKLAFLIPKDGKTMEEQTLLSEDLMKKSDPATLEHLKATKISYKFIDLKAAPEDKK